MTHLDLRPRAADEADRRAAESRHYWMLADARRSRRFRKAIRATVRPGDVVVDVGTGTGILAMFAVQAGAARVYAVEQDPQTAAIARELVARNAMADRIEVLEGDAAGLTLPEPVDLLICELIGNAGPEEDIEAVAAAVAARHLKPGGRCIPQRLQCYAVPVQLHPTPAEVFRADHLGVDLRLDTLLEDPQPGQSAPALPRPRRLGPAVPLEQIEVGRPAPCDRTEAAVELAIETPGVLQSVYGFFVAELAPGVRLRSFPAYPGGHWTPHPFPVAPPEPAAPGDRFTFTLRRAGFHTTHFLEGTIRRLA
jgi:SAM-dependent methyltransferase